MKKIISIVTAGLAALAAFVSCVKEPFAVFDASKATAPVVLSYTVTDDDVTVEYTPGTFGQSFNQNMPVNHYLLLTKVNGKDVEEVLPPRKMWSRTGVKERLFYFASYVKRTALGGSISGYNDLREGDALICFSRPGTLSASTL